ncbi:formylglycine-generating enzyme family protein [Myxococcota bacterium]|nr:formylglycine-generating enzyme family protein [Myxococcota bacterium]
MPNLSHQKLFFATITVFASSFLGCGGGDASSSEDPLICDRGYHPEAESCVADVPPTGYVLISEGTFTMGSPESELGRHPDEVEHLVTLSNSFYMKEYEVSQAEFLSLMDWNPAYFGPNGEGESCGEDCPVEMISWYDALAYANQLSISEELLPCYTLSAVVCTDLSDAAEDYMMCMNTDQGGIDSATVLINGANSYGCSGYRLPTEAEWEYAARAGATTAFYNGDNTYTECELDTNLDEIAWYCGNADLTTHPVGEKIANAWGLYDTSGNVNEWVWDHFESYDGDVTDPHGPVSGLVRVVRGGYWGIALYCRLANRFYIGPGSHKEHIGLRPCRSVR